MARITAPHSSRQDYEPVRKEPAMKVSSMKPDGAQNKEKTKAGSVPKPEDSWMQEMQKAKKTKRRLMLAAGGIKTAGGAGLVGLGLLAAKKALALVWGFLQAGVSTVVSIAAATVSALVTAGTTALVFAGVLTGGALSLMAAGAAMVIFSAPQRNVGMPLTSCKEEVEKVRDLQSDAVNPDAALLQAARDIYSVFKTWGMSDLHVAGILGNFQTESGLDAGRIEGIYGENFQKDGPKRQKALKNLSSYTQNELFGQYRQQGLSFHAPSYQGADGLYYCGLGLLQWTGPGAAVMMQTARAAGQDWDDLSFQLSYLLADIYRPGAMDRYKKTSFSSPEEAAAWFRIHIEGNSVYGMDKSRQFAKSWLGMMDQWSVDRAFASSILNNVSSLSDRTISQSAAGQIRVCIEEEQFDNSSIASAMTELAWPAIQRGNDGTPLYQRVMREIWPSDSFLQSPDRAIAAAVRWSGYDDHFPVGDLKVQSDYLKSAPGWKALGEWSTDLKEEKEVLKPGDLFIKDDHAFVYAGSSMIQKIHGTSAGEEAEVVEARKGQYGPCVTTSLKEAAEQAGGGFQVYRNVNARSSKYTSIASALTKDEEGKGSALGNRIVAGAKALQGIRMQCTELVTKALQAAGISAGVHWPEEYARYGMEVKTPQPGDIIIYEGRNPYDPSRKPHVAIYAGNGMAWHGNYGGDGSYVGVVTLASQHCPGMSIGQYIRPFR